MREVKTIVTTAGRPDDLSLGLAAFACKQLDASFEPRKSVLFGKSLRSCMHM